MAGLTASRKTREFLDGRNLPIAEFSVGIVLLQPIKIGFDYRWVRVALRSMLVTDAERTTWCFSFSGSAPLRRTIVLI